MMPWFWTGPTFTPLDYALFTFMGVASLLGHYLFTSAYREAPASLLAPVNYFHIGWAVLLGWVIFGHIPDLFTLAGMGMIALAGVAVAITAHYTKKTAIKT
jgi:drug/metabolite transporter (DMT)-like permease